MEVQNEMHEQSYAAIHHTAHKPNYQNVYFVHCFEEDIISNDFERLSAHITWFEQNA
jgi:hypothetical protein